MILFYNLFLKIKWLSDLTLLKALNRMPTLRQGFVKTTTLRAAPVLVRRASCLGLFWRLGWLVLLSFVVSGNNRSVRFRHAAVQVSRLSGQFLGGTTEAEFLFVVLHCLMFHLFLCGGFGYVSAKQGGFLNPRISN